MKPGLGARTCPRCGTRVDERRGKFSQNCLNCGQALNERLSAPPSIASSRAVGGSSVPTPAPSSPYGVYGPPSPPGMPQPQSQQYSQAYPPSYVQPYSQPIHAYGPLPGAMQGPPRSRTGLWVALGVGALIAVGGVVALVVHLLDVQSALTAQIDAGASGPVLPATTVEVPTASPTATGGAPHGGTKPGVHPAGGAFPRADAEEKIDRVAAGISSCKREATATGSGDVTIVFQPSGVVDATVGAPYKGTSAGACVAAKFGSVGVGKFTGSAVTVTHTFSIAP